MSEGWQIGLTAIVTILGGTIVYALGHFSVALFVEPIHRLRSLIGEITDSLIFYANVYSNPPPNIAMGGLYLQAHDILRRHASQLRARADAIPWYNFWASMKLIREKKEVDEASTELISLSNSVLGGSGITGAANTKTTKRIAELLGIRGM